MPTWLFGMKRLYKFILKRLIGKYLLDDLDYDQLHVKLRQGKVSLTNLELNVEAVNEALGSEIVFVEKVLVRKIQLDVNYGKILTESCLINVEGVDVVCRPAGARDCNVHQSSRSFEDSDCQKGELSESRQERGNETDRVDEADASAQGLDMLGRWIEQITSKVKVSVSDLSVRFLSSVSGAPSKQDDILFCASCIDYFDETPPQMRLLMQWGSNLMYSRKE